MGRIKRSKSALKAKKGQTSNEEEEYKSCPHSFVFHRGKVSGNERDLVRDMRRVMEPFTATSLKARKNNVLKDFVSVAGPLNVTHFMILTKTDTGVYLHMLRLPRGPTLTFLIPKYSLTADIVSHLKRHAMEAKQFKNHPLLIMNGFSGSGRHLKLMTSMFQNLFPSINVNKAKLKNIKRCVLMNYNAEDETLDFRHFNIHTVPVGMSKGVKKLLKTKVPNMGKFTDVSDYMNKAGDLSESEAELDGDHNEVILPQDMPSRGNIKSCKSAIRLTEIGPRLKLQLVKIQDGIMDGEVLYHKFVEYTDEQKQALEKKRLKKIKLKAQRKRKQEENVQDKVDKKEELKQKSLKGMREKFEEEKGANSEDSLDDADYFKQEVGHDPEPELFPYLGKNKKRKEVGKSDIPTKRQKFAPTKGGDDGKQNSKMAHGKDKGKGMHKDKGKGMQKDKGKGMQKKVKKPLTPLDKIKRRKLRTEQKKLKASKRGKGKKGRR